MKNRNTFIETVFCFCENAKRRLNRLVLIFSAGITHETSSKFRFYSYGLLCTICLLFVHTKDHFVHCWSFPCRRRKLKGCIIQKYQFTMVLPRERCRLRSFYDFHAEAKAILPEKNPVRDIWSLLICCFYENPPRVVPVPKISENIL